MSGGRLSDSTRHLCAGAYLDAAYRDRLIREVYLDKARRIPPSYGFELEPVLVHARRALVLEVACDVTLLGTVVAGLILVPAATVIMLLVLACWYAVRAGGRLSRDYLRYYFKRGTIDEYTHLQQRLKVLRWVWRGLAAVPALLLVALGLAAAGRVRLPTALNLDGLQTLIPTTAAILSLQTLAVAMVATVRHLSIRALRQDAAAPTTAPGARLRTVARQQAEPITIYSRFRPFIGSGFEVRTWSFVQRLIEVRANDRVPEREWDEPPFRTVDIVRHLDEQISSLAHDGVDLELRLSGLTVTDHIFVAGTKTADLPEEIATADPTDAMADPTGHARHYLACQIESWDGEIVTTVYVHASIQGKMLYLEFSTWALPPTRRDFHVMDQPGGVGVVAYAGRLARVVGALPQRLGSALPRLAGHAGHLLWSPFRPADDYDTRCRGVDIGARLSARELGAGIDLDDEDRPTNDATIMYFQHRDVLKYAKVIERRLLASVLDFLEDHHVDVSEYRQRMISILNVGAVNYGSGTVTVTDTAIGEGATVHHT